MPSFLSKVFGRKKEDAPVSPTSPKGHKSHPSLLEGKFEAVITPDSPIATNFAEAYGQPKDKEGGFGLFGAKSRPSTAPLPPTKRVEELPTLSLNLPGQKEENGSRVLGVVFEGDRQVLLDDSVIGAKRLNPAETLALVQACSNIITERGLETPGIMHPHWHSASPDIQRRLISLFIQSIAKKSPTTPTPFQTELKFTRSPHDVAAVLRWGLRHLKLDGSSFGQDTSEWSWYRNFSESEREAAYPPKVFSEKLVPLLPKSHLDLLLSMLEIESSLAAHAEHNSISGSKLSKFLGLWLLAASRSEVNDDWDAFYARWERAGRILEHLFLCRIRDESVNHRIPTRLMELVNQYPYYNKGSSLTDEELLPRPRFSTRSYDALFVRIDTELPTSTTEKPKRDRLRLLADAFKLDLPSEGGNCVVVWDKIKRAAVETSDGEEGSAQKDSPVLNRVFADETIRLLSLIPTDGTDSPINLISPSMAHPAKNRRRSSSLSHIPDHKGTNGPAPPNGNGAVPVVQAQTPLPPSPAIDWTEFTSAGFGEASTVSQLLSATLLDQDIEITDPAVIRKLSKGKRGRDTSRRSSADNPNVIKPNGTSPQRKVAAMATSKTTLVSVIQIDEAFVDFWSDAAIDPISSSWPTFVICKLNSIPGVQSNEGKPINWLVIEQTYSRPPVPRSASPTSPGKRASSPKPSVRSDMSRMNSSLAGARKRFSFFGGSGSTVPSGKVEKSKRKTSLKGIKAGEMGEVLPEVHEKQESKTDTPVPKDSEVKPTAAVADSSAARTAKSDEKVDSAMANNIDAKEFAAIASLTTGAVAVEKVAPNVPQVFGRTSAPKDTLPPAPKSIILSDNAPGPQGALDTSEPVAAAQAAQPPVATEPSPPAPVEVAPVPRIVLATPAIVKSLNVQEEPSILPAVEVPVVPVAPKPLAEHAEPVQLTPPIPEAPTPVEVTPEVAPEPANEAEESHVPELASELPNPVAEESAQVDLTHEVVPEPTIEPEELYVPEPAVDTEPTDPTSSEATVSIEPPHVSPGEEPEVDTQEPLVSMDDEAAPEPKQDAIEPTVEPDPVEAAESVEEPHPEPVPPAPEAEVSLEAQEPSANASAEAAVVEPTPGSQGSETVIEHKTLDEECS